MFTLLFLLHQDSYLMNFHTYPEYRQQESDNSMSFGPPDIVLGTEDNE